MMATQLPGLRRDGLGWRSIAWVLLIAFTLQSYVIQTHVHGSVGSFESAGAVKNLAKSPGHGKAPSEDGSLDCPFCQAIVHAGLFLTPAAPLLSLPSVWAECVALPIIAGAIRLSSSHNWQSRAPPLK
jgi:hypothetical protein